MGYNDNHYFIDENGYKNQAEIEKAYNNGHLEKLSNGYWDKQTGEEFWPDGSRKN